MKHLTSRQNPIVSRYRAAAEGTDRSHVLVDGAHLVGDALDAGLPITTAVVLADALGDAAIAPLVSRLVSRGATVCSASPAVMAALSPVRSASPIVGLAARPARGHVFARDPVLVVCGVDIQDPGNVGAIVRAAEAAGATGAAVTGRSADPFGWKALRGAMGSTFRLPVRQDPDPATFLAEARRHGCRIFATVPRDGERPDTADLRGASVLVVGGEGGGLPSWLIADADTRLSIPMAPTVESLNTAVCAALLVYEAHRQRQSLRPATGANASVTQQAALPRTQPPASR